MRLSGGKEVEKDVKFGLDLDSSIARDHLMNTD